MSKAEKTFNLMEGLRSLFKRSEAKPRDAHEEADPALMAFARQGMLAYYANPL